MKINDYQQAALSTALYPKEGVAGIAYTALGLNGEAGEVAEKVKKIIRDSANTKEAMQNKKWEIAKELGDVLWYVATCSHEFGLSLEEVAQMNVNKLKSRQQRNVIKGNGDNR